MVGNFNINHVFNFHLSYFFESWYKFITFYKDSSIFDIMYEIGDDYVHDFQESFRFQEKLMTDFVVRIHLVIMVIIWFFFLYYFSFSHIIIININLLLFLMFLEFFFIGDEPLGILDIVHIAFLTFNIWELIGHELQ